MDVDRLLEQRAERGTPRGLIAMSDTDPLSAYVKRSRHRGGGRAAVVLGLIGVGLAVAVGGVLVSHRGGPVVTDASLGNAEASGPSAATSSTLSPEMQQQWERIQDQNKRDMEASLPRPLLSAEAREAYRTAYDEQAACYKQHGVDVPALADSFGDGNTPLPMLGGPSGSTYDMTTPRAAAAQAECPFPLDDKFQAELESAVADSMAKSATG